MSDANSTSVVRRTIHAVARRATPVAAVAFDAAMCLGMRHTALYVSFALVGSLLAWCVCDFIEQRSAPTNSLKRM